MYCVLLHILYRDYANRSKILITMLIYFSLLYSSLAVKNLSSKSDLKYLSTKGLWNNNVLYVHLISRLFHTPLSLLSLLLTLSFLSTRTSLSLIYIDLPPSLSFSPPSLSLVLMAEHGENTHEAMTNKRHVMAGKSRQAVVVSGWCAS